MNLKAGGDVGQFSSIATHPVFGWPTVACYDADNQAVARVTLMDHSLVTSVIYYTAGGHTSLKIADAMHIAYYSGSGDPDRLMHAEGLVPAGTGNCGSTIWQCDEIDSGPGVGQYPSLALDGSGQPRIA